MKILIIMILNVQIILIEIDNKDISSKEKENNNNENRLIERNVPIIKNNSFPKLINDINKEKEVPSLKKIIHKQISYEKQKESLSKIKYKIKKCLNNKIQNLIENENNQKAFQDWFIFENAGDIKNCKHCEFNEFCKPKIYYITNRISIKLEKYFYVIMNKFDS